MKRWRVALSILFFFLLITTVFVSCDNIVIPYKEELVEVLFTLNEEKTLEANVDTDIALYTYTAEALFTLSDGSFVYGDTNGVEKEIGKTGLEKVGPFTQGKWRFHVYAYNKDGALIRDGMTDVYLKKDEKTGLTNVVSIKIERTQIRTGSIRFSFKATRLDKDEGKTLRVEVTPVRQGEAKAKRVFYSNSKTETEESFDFTLTGLQSGVWEFRLELYSYDVKVGGSTISTYILGNGKTEVTGEIYPTEWISVGFSITMPIQVSGTIGTSVTVAPGTVTYKWKNHGAVIAKYEWFVDGILKESGASKDSFTYTFSNPGVYSVTCVAYDNSGKEMGSSTCVTEVVVSETPKNIFTWTNPKKATGNTGSLSGTVTKMPTVRIHVEDASGSIIYSGFPSLTGSNGSWTDTVSSSTSALKITVSLSGNQIKVSYTEDVVGTVSLEVAL